jgi:hypothetical protein
MMVFALVMRVRARLKIRHSLRSGCPCGQRHSLACLSHSKSQLESVGSSHRVVSYPGTRAMDAGVVIAQGSK